MSDITIVTINGDDYYVSDDNSQHLYVVGGYLVNNSNSNITMYQQFRSSTAAQIYPYIQCQSMRKCVLYSGQNNSRDLAISSYSVKSSPIENSISSIYLLFAILGVCLCQLLKR